MIGLTMMMGLICYCYVVNVYEIAGERERAGEVKIYNKLLYTQ